MSSSVQKTRVLLCFDGQWVQNNNGWDYIGYTKRGVYIPIMVAYKTFIDYVVGKCGIGDSAACKLVFRRADGSLMEITNDDEILGFMLLAADSEIPPQLFVYVAPSMGDDEDDDEGDDEDDDEIHVGGSQLEPDSQFQASYDTTLYSDHAYRPNESYPEVVPETQLEEEEEEEEAADPKRRFVGVADDETHVFTTGISDLDRSDTDNDEDEETYTPSNKSFGALNDYFDMPPSLPNPETHIPAYQPAPYNRSTTIHEGQIFHTKEEMTVQLGMKFLREGFVFRAKKSDKRRYKAVCDQQNCEWSMSAKSVGPKGGLFVVRKLNDVHTCSRTQLNASHRQANKRTLGHILKDKFLDASRSFRPKDIVNDINQQYGINIGYHQGWRARCKALLMVRGTPEESYERLPAYLYNLELKNPGTRTRIRTDSNGRFELCFAALGCAIRTFLTNLRPVLVIDAAHLKGHYLGMMFLAVAMDGNNNIVPLAFGVGKSETGEEWGWFLNMLRECIGSPEGLVFMSDRAPSISAAISAVYPSTPHALCCRHLEMNVKSADKRITTNKTTYWKACKAYTIREFETYMNALRYEVPRGAQVMDEAGKERWSRAHFPAQRYNIMTSNSVESVNALSRFARRLPIVGLIEYFRDFQQEWYQLRRRKGG